jgi:hypothetical protein
VPGLISDRSDSFAPSKNTILGFFPTAASWNAFASEDFITPLGA